MVFAPVPVCCDGGAKYNVDEDDKGFLDSEAGAAEVSYSGTVEVRTEKDDADVPAQLSVAQYHVFKAGVPLPVPTVVVPAASESGF